MGKPPKPPETYTVKSGDTLFDIAREHCGGSSNWRKLYDKNREVIGRNGENLVPGVVLALPEIKKKKGELYVLNSAVITSPGVYTYNLIPQYKAAEWLQRHQGKFVSRVGYPATANYIKKLSGVYPEVNRDMTRMKPGDEALVVRLRYRVSNKVNHNPGEDDWEFGILLCK